LRNPSHDLRKRRKIRERRITVHRHAREAKGELRRNVMENFVGASTTRAAVGDNAYAVPAGDLLPGQIDDVTEQPTDRGAKDVQNLQGSHGLKIRSIASATGRGILQSGLGLWMVNKT
jgi:hypothetical protein